MKAKGKDFIFDNIAQWFGSDLNNCWVGFDTRRGQDNLEKRLVEVYEKGHELKRKSENRRASLTEDSSAGQKRKFIYRQKKEMKTQIRQIMKDEDKELKIAILLQLIDETTNDNIKTIHKLNVFDLIQSFSNAVYEQSPAEGGANSKDASILKRHLITICSNDKIGFDLTRDIMGIQIKHEFYQKCVAARKDIMDLSSEKLSCIEGLYHFEKIVNPKIILIMFNFYLLEWELDNGKLYQVSYLKDDGDNMVITNEDGTKTEKKFAILLQTLQNNYGIYLFRILREDFYVKK